MNRENNIEGVNARPMPKKFNFSEIKELNKKYELDNIDDLWYFVKSKRHRWIAGNTK